MSLTIPEVNNSLAKDGTLYQNDTKIPGAPGAIVSAEDPEAPSKEVSSRRQRLSDIFTIFCSGAALVSDGYQNNLMLVYAYVSCRYRQDG